MGVFAINKYNAIFAIFFGTFLFGLNFRVVFTELEDNINWWHALLFLIYIALIIKVVIEPVGELKEMTPEELDDHEYEKLDVKEE